MYRSAILHVSHTYILLLSFFVAHISPLSDRRMQSWVRVCLVCLVQSTGGIFWNGRVAIKEEKVVGFAIGSWRGVTVDTWLDIPLVA